MYFPILTGVENGRFNGWRISKILLKNVDWEYYFSKMKVSFMQIDCFVWPLFGLNALYFTSQVVAYVYTFHPNMCWKWAFR